MLTETILTLYNRVIDSEGATTYHRSVMRCHWEEEVGNSPNGTNKNGIRSANGFVPHGCAPSGKEYVDPAIFASSPSGHFTFAAEDVCFPYLVEGNSVMTGSEMKELKRTHKDYFVVSDAWNNNFGSKLMRHWEFRCQH